MNDKQVKSKNRVIDHGEVFTSEREVNAMLDLVKEETERIDSRFLEPACGDGNFLSEILRRKLFIVSKRYKNNSNEYEKYSVLAISSIYGVELLQDNVKLCQNRLFKIWEKEYRKYIKNKTNQDCLKSVKFILNRNILCGDALTLRTINGKPIIFSEWSFLTNDLIKRRDFRLDEMLEGKREQLTLFMTGWEYDEDIQAYIPKPIKEYPLIHFREIYKYAE